MMTYRRQSHSVLTLLTSAFLVWGCDSKKDDGAEVQVEAKDLGSSSAEKSAADKNAATDVGASEKKADGDGSEKEGEGAGAETKGEGTSYSCALDSIWTKKEYKALQTGELESLNEGVELPSLAFKDCEGVEHCQELVLSEGQKLLTVGQNGNDLRLVVAETCGDNTAVLVSAEKGPAMDAFRGKDMAFESAVVGGDRFLVSGFARHRSEKAKEGFTPREYLVTGRQGQFAKLEPARNKQNAQPVAAASQIVQVKTDKGLCTTMFWKLGVEQCDFEGPSSDGSVLIGSQMIYPEGGKGMKWNQKDGASELLPKLDWIVGDGVNVLWSTGEALFMTQPRWDLPELKSEPLAGGAGEKPIAFGCGRSLEKADDGYHLRNLKMGSEWVLEADRFGGDLTAPVAMNCDVVLTGDGKKFALTGLGGLKTLEDQPKTPIAKEGKGAKAEARESAENGEPGEAQPAGE